MPPRAKEIIMFKNTVAAVTTVALGLLAAGTAQAASQEEWGHAAPTAAVSQQAQVPVKAEFAQGERPDYLAAPAGQLTRAQVNADTQRWMKGGLRQFGAGEGGALNYSQTRDALKAYGQAS